MTTQNINFDHIFDFDVTTSANKQYLDCQGTWTAKITEALYSKNKAGTKFRGEVKLEVLEALDGSVDKTGATTSVYINEADNEALTARNINPFVLTLIANGVTREKILDDVKNYQELIQSIITLLSKLITRGSEIKIVVQTKAQGKNDDKGRPMFYKNVYPR